MENNLKIEDELLKINRRLDRYEKNFDLWHDDRNILESIQARITALEEAVHLARQNDNAVRKDIKEEIQITGDKVVAAVETEIQKKIKRILPKKWFWQRM